jgi:hypothetical protein
MKSIKKMKTFLFPLSAFLFFTLFSAEAKIWRVNNDATKNPNFVTIQSAVSSVTVATGDTLHIEPSATPYAGFTLTKRLVIIGNGYFLTNNTLLQANTLSSQLNGQINITNSSGNGSVISGLNCSFILLTNVSTITITHCLINTLSATNYTLSGTGIVIRKCFITSIDMGTSFSGAGAVMYTIENNIFSAQTGQGGNGIFPATTSGLFRNNTINVGLNSFTLNNCYVSNNIFAVNSSQPLNGGNNVVRNNLNAGSGLLPTGSGNQNGVDMTAIFVGPIATGTGDARFQLKSTPNAATTGGETIGTVITPACGAYGATDPYRISGIPPVPSIYVLTVPTSVAPTDATMNISISTRSNN